MDQNVHGEDRVQDKSVPGLPFRERAIQLRTEWQNELSATCHRTRECSESLDAFMECLDQSIQSEEGLHNKFQTLRSLYENVQRDIKALGDQEAKASSIASEVTRHDYRLLKRSQKRLEKNTQIPDLSGLASIRVGSVEGSNLTAEIESPGGMPEPLNEYFSLIKEIKILREILDQEFDSEMLDHSREDFGARRVDPPPWDWAAERRKQEEQLQVLLPQVEAAERICLEKGLNIDPDAWTRDNESASSQDPDSSSRIDDWLQDLEEEPLPLPEPLSPMDRAQPAVQARNQSRDPKLDPKAIGSMSNKGKQRNIAIGSSKSGKAKR